MKYTAGLQFLATPISYNCNRRSATDTFR